MSKFEQVVQKTDPQSKLLRTWEILWAFGIDAMQSFTHQYQSMTTIDFTHLPYWDLCAALRPVAQIAQWGLDNTTERTMRERHSWFVTQAFEKLSIQ